MAPWRVALCKVCGHPSHDGDARGKASSSNGREWLGVDLSDNVSTFVSNNALE